MREARKLTADVVNPDGDKRVKHDWRKCPVWKAGTIFYMDLEKVEVGDHTFTVPKLDNGRYSHQSVWEKKLVGEFLDKSVKLTDAERTFDVRLRELEGQGGGGSERLILLGLLKLGKISLDDLRTAFEAPVDDPDWLDGE